MIFGCLRMLICLNDKDDKVFINIVEFKYLVMNHN